MFLVGRDRCFDGPVSTKIRDKLYVPQAVWDGLPPHDYPVYAPTLIVEVLSPSNPPAKVSRQRIVAMSAGAQGFWVVDPETRTVLVTDLSGTRLYAVGDAIPITMFEGTIAVDDVFAI